jgi:hypothetical protein
MMSRLDLYLVIFAKSSKVCWHDRENQSVARLGTIHILHQQKNWVAHWTYWLPNPFIMPSKVYFFGNFEIVTDKSTFLMTILVKLTLDFIKVKKSARAVPTQNNQNKY